MRASAGNWPARARTSSDRAVLEAALRQLASRSSMRIGGTPRLLGRAHAHELYRITTDHGPLFLKLGTPAAWPMLEAEAQGLTALKDAQALPVPACIDSGVFEEAAYLALEWLELTPATPADHAALGRGLAAQHRVTGAAHGWHRDNWLGAAPQFNDACADWPSFWRERRLHPQLERAAVCGLPATALRDGRRVLDGLDALLDGHRPEASLLHGDLWAGNWGVAAPGHTVYVFDPAVYYGDREADLAMTALFGGFGPSFYAAYAESWPLEDGATARRELYALYHLLNHFNLFGRAYEDACCASLRALAARLGS